MSEELIRDLYSGNMKWVGEIKSKLDSIEKSHTDTRIEVAVIKEKVLQLEEKELIGPGLVEFLSQFPKWMHAIWVSPIAAAVIGAITKHYHVW